MFYRLQNAGKLPEQLFMIGWASLHVIFILSDIIDNLEHENLVLKEKNVSLQEQVTLLEKAIHNVSQESSARKQSRGM